jgi:hypothetical protein
MDGRRCNDVSGYQISGNFFMAILHRAFDDHRHRLPPNMRLKTDGDV